MEARALGEARYEEVGEEESEGEVSKGEASSAEIPKNIGAGVACGMYWATGSALTLSRLKNP